MNPIKDIPLRPSPPFAVEHVLPILRDQKTQTRRVLLPQPSPLHWNGAAGVTLNQQPIDAGRYGQAAARWYLREPIYRGLHEFIFYAADHRPVTDDIGGQVRWQWVVSALASMYMPARCARAELRVSQVRVEPLSAINDKDVTAEGYSDRAAYFEEWDRLNLMRGYGVKTDPIVIVYDFKVSRHLRSFGNGAQRESERE